MKNWADWAVPAAFVAAIVFAVVFRWHGPAPILFEVP
jgi:hypothetical protein